MGRKLITGLLVMTSACCVRAQHTDASAFHADSALSRFDSLSIISLIDSLLDLEEAESSQLAIRLSYNSNVLSAGRTLGIENFGLSPGLSYFHRSGFYGDVTAYWSKDFEPSYYLTVMSAGYMRDFGKHFSVMAGYDRYFYKLAENVYIPYSNTLSVTPVIDYRPLSFSINYSYYFGDQAAHRIMPGITFTWQRTKVWKLDRITVTPSVFALYGNEVITTISYELPETIRERLQNLRAYGTRYKTVIREKDVFGIMNYAVSVPFSVSYKKWFFTFTYIYNMPKALPGEPKDLSNSTYLTGSLMYLIDLRSLK